jgi:hypothetical protein
VAELTKPFERLWEWIDKTGGFPGKVMFACIVVMLIVGGFTWISNRRG